MMNRPPPPALAPSADLVIDSEQTVWEGRFPLQVVHFRHRRFDGAMSATRRWEVWRRGRAAALLPYDPVADAVVLIEQFRLPAAAAGLPAVLMELPAGLCDDGEQPEETIRRETMEEAGLLADRLEPIGDFLLSPGGCDEHTGLFAGRIKAPKADADGIAGSAGLAAEHEDIRIRVVPAAAAIAAALDGAYPNVITTVALLWLAAKRDTLRENWTKT